MSPRALPVDGALGVLLREGGAGWVMGWGFRSAPAKGAMSGEAHAHLGVVICGAGWCARGCVGSHRWEADSTAPVPSSWPPTPDCGLGVHNGTSDEWFGGALMHTPHDCFDLRATHSLSVPFSLCATAALSTDGGECTVLRVCLAYPGVPRWSACPSLQSPESDS